MAKLLDRCSNGPAPFGFDLHGDSELAVEALDTPLLDDVRVGATWPNQTDLPGR